MEMFSTVSGNKDVLHPHQDLSLHQPQDLHHLRLLHAPGSLPPGRADLHPGYCQLWVLVLVLVLVVDTLFAPKVSQHTD